MPLQQKLMAKWIYAQNFETPREEITCVKQLLEIDDQSPNYHFILGLGYLSLYQYDKAIPEYEKASEILQKSWDLRRKYAVYDHQAFLHLEEAEKAVASQKNN